MLHAPRNLWLLLLLKILDGLIFINSYAAILASALAFILDFKLSVEPFLFTLLSLHCLLNYRLHIYLSSTILHYRTLHCMRLARACRSIHNVVAVPSLKELFTHTLAIELFKHLCLTAFPPQDWFKDKCAFTIVKVVVSVYLYSWGLWKNRHILLDW